VGLTVPDCEGDLKEDCRSPVATAEGALGKNEGCSLLSPLEALSIDDADTDSDSELSSRAK
jgi:hypothetical protein